MSIEDKRAYDAMEKTSKLINGHYTLSLPWREDNVKLHNNKPLATSRLHSLKRRLENSEDLHKKYTDQIESYIAKNYAVMIRNPVETTNKTWYLPHQAVANPNKPGKVRVVFDCAAKFRGYSLNDKLLHGPDLVNSLTGVLMRFRQENIAVMGDIESIFHQVNVSEEDTESLRFLWWPGGDLKRKPKESTTCLFTCLGLRHNRDVVPMHSDELQRIIRVSTARTQ